MPDFGIRGNSPIKHNNAGLGNEAPKPKLERQNGGRMQAPEGLTARGSTGGAAPRQPLKLGGEKKLKPDAETQEAIDSQKQQSANSAALAKATAEAAGQQALMEHLKSMAEMQAQSIKSGGEMLKKLV